MPAVVAGLVLTGCGGDGSTPSRAATALPSVTRTADVEPFVRRWLADQQQMQVTGRTAPYVAANRRCQECRRLADLVHSFYVAGGFIRGGGYQVQSIHFAPSQGGGIATVHAKSGPGTIKTSSTTAPHHFDGHRVVMYLRLARRGGSFTVTSSTSN